MGWALLKPWNLALVAAVVVLSGPLTVAAICSSLLSATLLGLLAGAILLHAAFTSICRVIFWPLVSSPPASAAASSTSSRGNSRARGLSSETPVPRQPSPLLVIQGSGRSRSSRGSSLGQRVSLPVPSTGSSPSGTTTSSSSTSSSASPSFNSGLPFNGNDNSSTPGTGPAGSGGHRQGVFGLGVGQGPTGEGGSSATGGRRHSLVLPIGDHLDGNGAGTDGFYDDDDDEPDDYYYYPDEIEHGGSGGLPSDFAPQLTLSSRVFHQGGDMNPTIRLFQQRHQQYHYSHPQQSQLLTMLRSGDGQAMPVASNSSRRRASIGGVPSLLRAGGAGAGFGGSSAPAAAYMTSRSGSSTPWKRTRRTSEFGL